MAIPLKRNQPLIAPAPPNLPLSPPEVSQRYIDQLNNVLRLYFNQLNNFEQQFVAPTGGSLLQFPNGAFYQDGVTTLTTGITNTSTTAIVVASSADFALSAGGLIVGTEIIKYTGKTATTFTGITRGAFGSTKAAHLAGATITEAQTLAAPTVATPAAVFKTTSSNGVSIDPTDLTKVVFAVAGIYNIQFSIQMINYGGVVDDVTVWFRLNGVDIPYSAGIATVPAIHGGVAGGAILSWNLVQPIKANDYIQLMFTSDTGDSVAATYAGGAAPVHPISPSIIISATFVSALFT